MSYPEIPVTTSGGLPVTDSVSDPVWVAGVWEDCAGTITAGPALTGAIDRYRNLISSIEASPTLGGLLNRVVGLSSSDLTVGPGVGPNPLNYTAAMAGEVGTTVELTLDLEVVASDPNMSGSFTQVVSITGNLSVLSYFAGAVTAAPAITGAATRVRILGGPVTAVALITGTAIRYAKFVGSLDQRVNVWSERLRRVRALSAALIVPPAVTGTMLTVTPLAGVVTAVPTVDGNIYRVQKIAGLVDPRGNPTGTMYRDRPLAGLVRTRPTVGGLLNAVWALSGEIAPYAYVFNVQPDEDYLVIITTESLADHIIITQALEHEV